MKVLLRNLSVYLWKLDLNRLKKQKEKKMNNKQVDYLTIFEKIVRDVSKILGKPITSKDFKIVDRGVPHKPPQKKEIPCGYTAVYTFLWAEKDCFLKIGKAGGKSTPRLTTQHYHAKSTRSNLSKQLLEDIEMSKKYKLTEENVSEWIKNNCRRIDIYFNPTLGKFANELCEACLHFRFNPKYENGIE